MVDIVFCPFCDEKGFNKLGLKIHLINNRCESYNKIDAPDFSKESPQACDHNIKEGE